jgi:hypothetical protein
MMTSLYVIKWMLLNKSLIYSYPLSRARQRVRVRVVLAYIPLTPTLSPMSGGEGIRIYKN